MTDAGLPLQNFNEGDPAMSLAFLDGGFNSQGFRIGSQVVKISQASGSEGEMRDLAQIMQEERAMMGEFIGDWLPPTDCQVLPSASHRGSHVVATTQEFQRGLPLPEYMADPRADTAELRSFLRQCLTMHEAIGVIPDLANLQTGFDIFKNTNVIMSPDVVGTAKPVLTDPFFGKVQRSWQLGRLWTHWIAGGVERGLKKLEGAQQL